MHLHYHIVLLVPPLNPRTSTTMMSALPVCCWSCYLEISRGLLLGEWCDLRDVSCQTRRMASLASWVVTYVWDAGLVPPRISADKYNCQWQWKAQLSRRRRPADNVCRGRGSKEVSMVELDVLHLTVWCGRSDQLQRNNGSGKGGHPHLRWHNREVPRGFGLRLRSVTMHLPQPVAAAVKHPPLSVLPTQPTSPALEGHSMTTRAPCAEAPRCTPLPDMAPSPPQTLYKPTKMATE